MDITIDTQVMMIGSGKSNIKCEDCNGLLLAVMNHPTVMLAIDEKGHIKGEYDRHMGKDPGCLCTQLLRQFGTTNRIRRLPWNKKDWRSWHAKLRDIRFHADDHKFVRTAEASASKRLVAQEKGYSDGACKLLKDTMNVVVLTAKQAKKSL